MTIVLARLGRREARPLQQEMPARSKIAATENEHAALTERGAACAKFEVGVIVALCAKRDLNYGNVGIRKCVQDNGQPGTP